MIMRFSFIHIYPKELEPKFECQGNNVSFLNLDIKTDRVFVGKLSDKKDQYPFFILRMSHLSSNIPSLIFYGSIFLELLRVARYTRRTNDFIPRTYDLFIGMIAQGGNRATLTKQLKNAFYLVQNIFQKFV